MQFLTDNYCSNVSTFHYGFFFAEWAGYWQIFLSYYNPHQAIPTIPDALGVQLLTRPAKTRVNRTFQ